MIRVTRIVALSVTLNLLIVVSPFAGQFSGFDVVQGGTCDNSGDTFRQALIDIKGTSSEFNDMVVTLGQSKPPHRIVYFSGDTVSVHAKDPDDRHQVILWNPLQSGRYSNGVCIDSTAALVHEMWHALDNQAGGLRMNAATINASTNFIPRSEVDAINAENLYRQLHHMCQRTTWYGLPLPNTPKQICPGNANPFSQPCPVPVSQCSPSSPILPPTSKTCCCWINGLLGPGKGACIIDKLTDQQCQAYSMDRPGVSAGCTGSPCDWPGTPPCP